jgi:hypothetical protein
MNKGDMQTITLKMAPNGTFPKTIEKEWLRYLGYDEKEIQKNGGEIEMLILAVEEKVGSRVQMVIKMAKA